MTNYQLTVGIECHVQLNTKTKLFAAVSNDAIDLEPNTVISPICFGLPGVLPVLNKAVVDLAIKAGTALNAKIELFSKFDRKHYFYPDLPKGYQITQFDQPTVGEGFVEVPLNGEIIKVGIERAHLEEDAGKSIHPSKSDYSLVDLNRAGTPLLEIVSKPDIHSAEVAKAYAKELYLLMKYADVSDVDLYHGHMRFDVNVSVAKKASKSLGARSEVKNLNSFRSVERAVKYEHNRQIDLIEKGQKIIQETRGWDDTKQSTFAQRGKEEAHDYRYFPEPDVPPILLDKEYIENIASNMGDLPWDYRRKLDSLKISQKDKDSLISTFDKRGKPLAQYINEAKELNKQTAGFYTQWLLNSYLSTPKEDRPDLPSIEQVSEVYRMFKEDNTLSSNNAYILLNNLSAGESAADLAKELKLVQSSNISEIENIVKQVIDENPKAAADVKNGQMKAIGFLVGQVMKNSHGKVNPQIAKEQIIQVINKL